MATVVPVPLYALQTAFSPRAQTAAPVSPLPSRDENSGITAILRRIENERDEDACNRLWQAYFERVIRVQRQMKCAEEDRSLNREWTRIAAVIKCGFISNDSLNSAGYEVMAREQRILAFFDLIRVHSRPFAVQN